MGGGSKGCKGKGKARGHGMFEAKGHGQGKRDRHPGRDAGDGGRGHWDAGYWDVHHFPYVAGCAAEPCDMTREEAACALEYAAAMLRNAYVHLECAAVQTRIGMGDEDRVWETAVDQAVWRAELAQRSAIIVEACTRGALQDLQ